MGKKSGEAKTAAEPSTPANSSQSPGIRLPDGTFLWTGPGTRGQGERVLLTPEELQKLYNQVEELKKQLAARKPTPPSSCTIHSRVEKRGDVLVAVSRVTYTFRTTAANAAVALNGRRAFLVAATLDANKLPILISGEDGFAALIESAGDHTVRLDLESPVGVRGTKTEIGFELALPRAAITTLALAPPSNVKRVNLSTRTPDPGQLLKPADTRRIPGLDVKHLASRSGQEGYALGPIDLLEVVWEPPAAAPLPDAVQSAVVDVTCLLAEGFVETAARFQPRGTSRVWRIAAPADCVLSVDRSDPGAAVSEPGMVDSPTISRPPEPGKPVWTVQFRAGTSASDWVISALLRAPRAKTAEGKHDGPFVVGPFTVLDVSRQTGTVQITAPANTRLTFRHGPDLRRSELPAPAEDETVALFRLATGPTGSSPPSGALVEFDARPLDGTIEIRPTYRFTLNESGWRLRAELRVTPIRKSIDTVKIQLPADWRGSGVTPPEVVEGVQQVKEEGPRQTLAVRLAAIQRQPFDIVLTASLPVAPSAQEAFVELPRFPDGVERDATIQATVPDGFEVRGSAREWEGDQPSRWGRVLVPVPAADGKPSRAKMALNAKFENGLARIDLAWSPYRPELITQLDADVTVQDGQLHVVEQVRLQAPDGFAWPVRFQARPGARGLTVAPAIDLSEPGHWIASFAPEAKEASVRFEYALAVPARTDSGRWEAPVDLIWPMGSTRTQSVVRVWNRSATARVTGAGIGPWRSMPPAPTPESEYLPVLALAGFGSDLPLVLDLAEASGPTAAAVWVDRGLLQVWIGDDGMAGCRARFLLSRWSTDTVEMQLPDSIAGPSPEVLVDGHKTEPEAVFGSSGRRFRVHLPQSQPGRTAVLELRYHLAAGNPETGSVFSPPWPTAAIVGPVRWQITVPPGRVPLVLGGGRVEQRWSIHSALPVPAAAPTDALERWFQAGEEPGAGTASMEAAVVRLAGAEAIRVLHLPRFALVVICSVVVLVVGLILSRLPSGLSGSLVALLGGAAAVLGVLFPQPTGQLAVASVPGLGVLLLVLGTMTAGRWYQRRRITHLPGFTRGQSGPLTTVGTGSIPSSGRGQPLAPGSTGPHEDAFPSGTPSVATASR